MQTREISRERWPQFLGEFTQLHHGEQVSVETIGKGTFGVRSEIFDLPLAGIVTAEPKAGTDEEEWIEIVAGDAPARQMTHAIPHPSRVVVVDERDGEGMSVALQIESTDGSITMVRIEPPLEGLPPGFTVA